MLLPAREPSNISTHRHQIARQAIRCGSFISVRQLTDTIGAFIDRWNDHPTPFAWTKDARRDLRQHQPGED
jgi:hypothetical protein